MTCTICKHGTTSPGTATVTLEREGTVVVFKEVPGEVCENCGEHYLSEEVTRKLLAEAKEASRSGTEVEVRKFAA